MNEAQLSHPVIMHRVLIILIVFALPDMLTLVHKYLAFDSSNRKELIDLVAWRFHNADSNANTAKLYWQSSILDCILTFRW